MTINRIHVAWLVAALGLAGSGAAYASPETTAIFGLYQAGASATLEVNSAVVDELGCDIQLTGKIVAQDGDVGLPKPDAFVVLACPKPALGPSGAALDQLVKGAKRIALFEGGLVAVEPHEAGKRLGDRQYILKISYFNNIDPSARLRNLTEIGALVAKRQDQYNREGAIEVSNALGARRPDEVDILYYDDASAGDRFRTDNPDIMGLIGQFNSRHVESFIYYVGIAQD
jgi:hypothetical protein